MRRHQLLVVDWDSFFPIPEPGHIDTLNFYDWSHKETEFHMDALWTIRAETFLRLGRDLPDTTGEEKRFWERFKITADARLWYADSNACAVNPVITGKRKMFEGLWLYDAHHDSGYYSEDQTQNTVQRYWLVRKLLEDGQWSCDNWMVLYAGICGVLEVRYPRWKPWAMTHEPEPIVSTVHREVDDGSSPDRYFDHIFVCRSSAWVPPWNNLDARFDKFIDDAPVKASRKQCIQPGGMMQRQFNMNEAREHAALTDLMLKAAKISRETGEDQATVWARLVAE